MSLNTFDRGDHVADEDEHHCGRAMASLVIVAGLILATGAGAIYILGDPGGDPPVADPYHTTVHR